jgi:hypothetical protein
MNTDKVLALAKEAGLAVTISSHDSLYKFAALIQQQMEAENAELRKDAERYRWLRQMDRCEPWSDLLMSPITRTEDIDEAIDRARSANE